MRKIKTIGESDITITLRVKQRDRKTGRIVPVKDVKAFINKLDAMFEMWAKDDVPITEAWWDSEMSPKDDPVQLIFTGARKAN